MQKNVLLFIFVFLLFAPSISAYPVEGEKIAGVFEQLSPFMNLNQADYHIKFDQQKAREYGLSVKYIETGKNYEAFHNGLIMAIKREGIRNAKIDRSVLAEFEPFFLFVAETGMMHQKTLTTAPLEINGVPPIILIKRQSSVTRSAKRKSSLVDVCGGSREHPHRCPARVASGVYRTSSSAISSYLRSIGYHNTYYPGCGTTRFTCNDDFTRWISANGCASGIFRTQAWPTGSGRRWSYSTQTPEPNPEIISYGWPVWWWGPYVFWWHSSYCN